MKMLKVPTELYEAVLKGDVETVHRLLLDSQIAKNDEIVNWKGLQGRTLLHEACIDGYFEIVKLLLEYDVGGDVNAKSDELSTALHYCVLKHDSVKLLNLLLEYGADINAKTNRGWTSLFVALREKRMNSIRFLCWKGASLDTPSVGGRISTKCLNYLLQDRIRQILLALVTPHYVKRKRVKSGGSRMVRQHQQSKSSCRILSIDLIRSLQPFLLVNEFE
jgi:ankyrin repeat protein